MVKTTPFHPRLRELNATGLWTHWSGYLSAVKYDMSARHEYFGVRVAAGYFDSSPLYKYWITGKDVERFLAGVLTRDIRTCRPGQAQYTLWSDDAGYVVEDGVFFRHSDNEFFVTTAEPNLGFFTDLMTGFDVAIEDVSDAYGLLAVQGPKSRDILARLAPEVVDLKFFTHTPAKIGGASVTVSRTGYTGDLGYEILVGADDAVTVLDAVIDVGSSYGLRPFGDQALSMARIEAGLALINVEFSSSRLAYNDDQRITASELGFGWMLRGIDDERPFIGRDAIRREIAEKSSRWSTVGLIVDWRDYNQLYTEAGLIPPMDEVPGLYDSMLYDDDGQRVGYATNIMYSPMLQSHIAMARVHPDRSAVGSRVNLELTVNHAYRTVAADITRLPFFNPPRKTA